MIGILLPVTVLGLMLQPPLNTRSTTPLSTPGTGTRAVVPLRMADGFVESVEALENKIKEHKTSTETSTVWPDFDEVRPLDKPLLQALATVCAKLYDPALFAAWTPEDPTKPDNTALDQAYVQSKPGGQYREGGVYDPTSGLYTNGPKTQALVEGIQIFNKDTTQVNGTKVSGTPSLADYGKVIAGLTDFHGTDQAAIPPFAALIVKPNDEEVRGTPIESPAIGGLLPITSSPPCSGRITFSSSLGVDQSRRSTLSTTLRSLRLSVNAARPPSGLTLDLTLHWAPVA